MTILMKMFEREKFWNFSDQNFYILYNNNNNNNTRKLIKIIVNVWKFEVGKDFKKE